MIKDAKKKSFGKIVEGFWIMGIVEGIVCQVYLVIVLVNF